MANPSADLDRRYPIQRVAARRSRRGFKKARREYRQEEGWRHGSRPHGVDVAKALAAGGVRGPGGVVVGAARGWGA
jgi:hypothetical protein